MRVNINIDEDLLKRIDKKAKSLSMSRSAYISLSCSQYLKSDELLEVIPDLMVILGQTREDIKQLNNSSLETTKNSKGKRNI